MRVRPRRFRPLAAAAAIATVALASGVARAQGGGRDALIARGEYLTHHVAMCVQCHTPRREDGSLLDDQQFMGAPMPVEAPPFTDYWCVNTPRIAGLPGWTEEQAVKFLMTGTPPRGRRPKNPMPPFRMTREDASAVVAYLKSLTPGPSRTGD